MRWVLSIALRIVGGIVGLQLLAFVIVAFAFVVPLVFKEFPDQWAELWKGKATAEVIQIASTCAILEAAPRGDRSRRVTTQVPCDRLDAEMAARPRAAMRIGPRDIVAIVFRTESDQEIRTTVPRRTLGLLKTTAPGHRFRISYDQRFPERVRKPAGDQVTFWGVVLGMVAATVGAGIWCWRWVRLLMATEPFRRRPFGRQNWRQLWAGSRAPSR